MKPNIREKTDKKYLLEVWQSLDIAKDPLLSVLTSQ